MSAPADAGGGAFGRFEILTAERRLRIDGQPVILGSRAFDLLAALVARRERVVSKDELIDVVWPGLVVEENNLQVQISALRKVLGSTAIATVPGRGYQFTVAAAAAAVAGGSPASRSSAAPGSAAFGQAPPAWPVERAGGAGAQAAHVLVADDNKVNRLLLCRSIELMGHTVAHVDNGRAALEALRRERFDLLLLDLEMPEIDGFGVLEQRAGEPALAEVPVIVTSSLEGAAAVARCLELGADDYLHKPVNPVLLKARVDSSLERKRLRDRQRELLARLAPGWSENARAGSQAPDGQRLAAALLVVRLHAIDALALAHEPAETFDLLNNWTALMLDAVEGHAGLVMHLAGGGLMAVFGSTPVGAQADEPAWQAAQAAQEMREMLALYNAERAALGKAAIGVGVGIAAGDVVAGYAGMPRRASYVCVGATVGRAAQLAEAAAAAGAVLIDAAVHAAVAGRMASKPHQPAARSAVTPVGPAHILTSG